MNKFKRVFTIQNLFSGFSLFCFFFSLSTFYFLLSTLFKRRLKPATPGLAHFNVRYSPQPSALSPLILNPVYLILLSAFRRIVMRPLLCLCAFVFSFIIYNSQFTIHNFSLSPTTAHAASTVSTGAPQNSTAHNNAQKIVRASSGNLYFAYTKSNQIYVAKSTNNGNTWSDMGGAPIQDISPYSQATPSIAIDSQDNLHVVWGGAESVPGEWIKYSKYNGTSWSVWTNIATGGTSPQQSPSIVVDSQDNLHVVWEDAVGANTQLEYTKYNGSSWSFAQSVATISGYPQQSSSLAADSLNNLHVVWSGISSAGTTSQIKYSKYNGSSWSLWTDIQFITGGNSQQSPSIAVDSQNNLHVVWSGKNSGNTTGQIKYSTCTSASTCFNSANWSAWTNIKPIASYIQSYPSIAIDSTDRLHVVWSGTDASSTTYSQIKYSTCTTTCQIAANWGAWTNKTSSGTANQQYPTMRWSRFSPNYGDLMWGWMDNTTVMFATDSTYKLKEWTLPTVIDNQTGDNTWRTTDPGAIYDVDFSDTGGSLLATAQYTVWSRTGIGTGTGTEIISWTNIAAGINAASYTTNWSINFGSATEGYNYVSVRAYDNANNVSTTATDVFYVKKDAVATSSTSLGPDNLLTAYNNSRKIVHDSSGNLYLTYYKQVPNQIFVAKSTDNGNTWTDMNNSTPITTVSGYDQFYPSIAIDSSDNMHVVWMGTDSTNTTKYQIKYSKYNGSSWSVWTNIQVVTNYSQWSPSLAIDSLGNLHVIWDGMDATYNLKEQIKYSKFDGNVWSVWTNIKPVSNSYKQAGAALAIDSQNALHVIWHGTDASSTTNNQIKYSKCSTTCSSSANWSVWTNITSPGTSYAQWYPSIAVDSNNNLHVAWYGDDSTDPGIARVKYSTYNGSTWTAWTNMQTPVGYSQRYPSVAVDSTDRIHLVWQGLDTSNPTYEQIKYSNCGANCQTAANWSAWTNKTSSSNAYQYYPNFQWSRHRTNYGNLDWIWTASGTTQVNIFYQSDSTYKLPDWATPTVIDLQTGDDTWYASSAGILPADVDFSDTGGSLLATAQYTVWSAPSLSSGTGSEIISWTNIATSINAASYTTNWSVPFASLTEGVNYVSARVWDNVGAGSNLPIIATDVFYIKKDTSAPPITYNSPTAGSNTSWYTADPGAVMDIDAGWLGGGANDNSPLTQFDYQVQPTATWVTIFSGSQSATYTTNWGVDWTLMSEGTNTINLRAGDAVGNWSTHTFATGSAGFLFRRDTSAPSAPSAVNDGISGDDIDTTPYTTQLSANWSAATDSESGIAKYWVAIGTTAGATDVLGWTDVGAGLAPALQATTVTGLSLASGTFYYFSVKSENGAGLINQTPTTSDGVTVQPSSSVSAGALTTSTAYNNARKLVRDNSGNLYLAYYKGSPQTQIYVAKSTDNGNTWSDIGGTPIQDVPGYDQNYPAIAVDSLDNLHCVWQGRDSVNTIANQIKYSKYSGGNWSVWTNTQTISGYDQNYPSMAIDSSDNLHVVWRGTDSGSGGTYQIKYSKYSGGSWDVWTNIQIISGYAQYFPSIAMDSSDNLHVVWQGQDSVNTLIDHIKYSKYNGISWTAWTNIQTISGYSQGFPSIAVDSSDNLHVVWHGKDSVNTANNQLKYSKYFGGSWSTWTNIQTISGYAQVYPSIAIDSQDNLYVVWHGKDVVNSVYSQIKYSTCVSNCDNPVNWSAWVNKTAISSASQLYPTVRWSRRNPNYGDLMWAWMDGTSVMFDKDSNYKMRDWATPTVSDLQAGDDAWIAAASGPYNVDFSDKDGSLLATAQYSVWSAPSLSAGTGTEVITWTNIATAINAASYTTNWSVNFASLTEGVNYVSARVWDNVGAGSNLPTVATDVFYVKKDTVAPSFIYASPPQGGLTVMYENATSSVIDVDFGWLGAGSATGTGQSAPLQWADYKIGAATTTWLNIFNSPMFATYTTNWSVDFGAATEGYNEISLRVADAAGNTATESYASNTAGFWYWKDTSPDLAISKTALCTSPIGYQNLGGGVNDCVPGALIHYTDTYSNSSAIAISVVIKDGEPTYTTHVAGSLKLNGVSKTDAFDGDECDFGNSGAGIITCNLPTLPNGVNGTLEHDVTID